MLAISKYGSNLTPPTAGRAREGAPPHQNPNQTNKKPTYNLLNQTWIKAATMGRGHKHENPLPTPPKGSPPMRGNRRPSEQAGAAGGRVSVVGKGSPRAGTCGALQSG